VTLFNSGAWWSNLKKSDNCEKTDSDHNKKCECENIFDSYWYIDNIINKSEDLNNKTKIYVEM
jgi:hypothetical protein